MSHSVDPVEQEPTNPAILPDVPQAVLLDPDNAANFVEHMAFGDFGDEENPLVHIPLTPDNFYKMVEAGIDYDDDEATSVAIENFVNHAALEYAIDYTEVPFEEDQITNLANRIDHEIADFIQDGRPMQLFDVMGQVEYWQLGAFYNPNNMLVEASAKLHQDGEITADALNTIYRYRAVLKRFTDVESRFVAAQQQEAYEEDFKKPGYKTWAGRVRLYGSDQDGAIDPEDFREFCDDRDDAGRRTLVIDDEEIGMRSIGGHLSVQRGARSGRNEDAD